MMFEWLFKPDEQAVIDSEIAELAEKLRQEGLARQEAERQRDRARELLASTEAQLISTQRDRDALRVEIERLNGANDLLEHRMYSLESQLSDAQDHDETCVHSVSLDDDCSNCARDAATFAAALNAWCSAPVATPGHKCALRKGHDGPHNAITAGEPVDEFTQTMEDHDAATYGDFSWDAYLVPPMDGDGGEGEG